MDVSTKQNQLWEVESAEITRGSIERLIVERIYKAIIEQRLAPRTKLSEAKLCEAFGVGRMHVQRALLLLSAQGIIDLQSNRGAYVACPDESEANEVFEARLLIEPSLVGHLASKPDSGCLDMLAEHLTHEDAAHARGERTELIRLSGEFHVKLAMAAENAVILKVVRELVTRTSLIVGLFATSPRLSCPDDEHAAILSAIRNRDPQQAEALMITHLEHIQQGLDMASRKVAHDDLAEILGSG